MSARKTIGICALLFSLVAATSCGYLRDKEPWDQTVRYFVEGSFLQVQPLVIQGDANFGIVNVVNDTPIKRGFAIRELSIFEEIPAGLTIPVNVDEARDGVTYTWTDHVNPKEDGTDPFEGKLIVEYVEEEFRDR